jgi:hypothetical protein
VAKDRLDSDKLRRSQRHGRITTCRIALLSSRSRTLLRVWKANAPAGGLADRTATVALAMLGRPRRTGRPPGERLRTMDLAKSNDGAPRQARSGRDDHPTTIEAEPEDSPPEAAPSVARLIFSASEDGILF